MFSGWELCLDLFPKYRVSFIVPVDAQRESVSRILPFSPPLPLLLENDEAVTGHPIPYTLRPTPHTLRPATHTPRGRPYRSTSTIRKRLSP